MSDPDPTMSDWATQAAVELLHSRNTDGGWPYRTGDPSSTEATSLAILALSVQQPAVDLSPSRIWLAQRQASDGFWPAADAHQDRSWTTPLAGLAAAVTGLQDAADLAVGALLDEPVFTFRPAGLTAGLYNYDPSVPGWPWTSGDFSFVEPTSLAMIFLKKQGQAGAGRVRDAAAMLRIRRLPDGQWNYGEPKVLNGELFPTVTPTSLGLIALADEQDASTDSALEWLQGQQGQITSLFSLGWACTALNVLGRLNDTWRADVAARWTAMPAARRNPMDTALCLVGLTGATPHPLSPN